MTVMQLTKKRSGYCRYGWYLWELITTLDLKINELAELQEKEGYTANCYGFYSPKKYQRNYESGKTEFRYKWQCSTTSD